MVGNARALISVLNIAIKSPRGDGVTRKAKMKSTNESAPSEDFSNKVVFGVDVLEDWMYVMGSTWYVGFGEAISISTRPLAGTVISLDRPSIAQCDRGSFLIGGD